MSKTSKINTHKKKVSQGENLKQMKSCFQHQESKQSRDGWETGAQREEDSHWALVQTSPYWFAECRLGGGGEVQEGRWWYRRCQEEAEQSAGRSGGLELWALRKMKPQRMEMFFRGRTCFRALLSHGSRCLSVLSPVQFI